MAINSSWVPDESPQTLFSERCWLQGVVVSCIAYGITVCLSFLSFYLLIHGKNRVEFRQRLPLLIYIVVTFLLGTAFTVALAAFNQMAFIDDRNYPGGPDAFENDMFSNPLNYVDCITTVLSNWISDALVLWRFKVIYQNCRVPMWIIMLFPYLMFAGSVAMGIMFLIQTSATSPYLTNGVDYTLVYLCITLALNVILTILIVLRLLSFRYQVVSALGPRSGTRYTSLAAMLVESAALYSAVSVTFLVLFGIKNPVSQVFLPCFIHFQSIAALLIVFRVAQGKAWTNDTATFVMSARTLDHSELPHMRFASPGDSALSVESKVVERSIDREFHA